MKNKKISVIIIGNDDIEKCLEEINKQSYIKDIEINLLYAKEKEDKIRKIEEIYPNVKFITLNKNIFKTIKENEELITGEFVSILNSEDSLTIDYYRTMVATAIKENSDIVISNSVLQYSDGGRAYLNLSEASLKNLENEKILNEYLKQSGLSFLWSIYGNKIYKKELFEKTLEEVVKIEDEVQNFYFFTIMLYYSQKIRIVSNEILFYNFEKNLSESVRCFTRKNKLEDAKLKENTENNFKYMQEFLEEKNIKASIKDWKDLYLNEAVELKKDLLTRTKTAWNDNLDKLKREIITNKTEIVSFDIFDTLIMRPFWAPEDLFTFLDKYFREISGNETGMDFSKIRIEAERTVRKKLCGEYKEKQEVTLEEIYQEIEIITGVQHNIIEQMKEKEKEQEIRFCVSRKTAKEICELAKYLNKKVICISDMYLPMETIQQMLSKNGYNIDKIYLSAEINLTKFKGDLYKYVIKDLQVEPKKIVHIGDNYFSDYENAIKYGINGQFLPKAVDVFCNENITNALGNLFKKNIPLWENTSNGLNFMGIRCMLALVANSYFDNPYRTFNNETDFNADPNLIGYYALGMHLFGITDWLLKNTANGQYKKVVFFARDGYWVMKAYEILKKIYNETPEYYYLYISRRALVPVTLDNKFDFYKLSELIDIYRYTPKTVLKYIRSILFNLENLEVECNKAGIDLNKEFENKNEFNVYMNLIIDKFYDKTKHIQMLENLKIYFLNVFTESTCAFDIGYSAKPEMYLSKLCQKSIDTYFVNISNEEALKHAEIGGFKLNTYFDYRPAITGVVRESLMSTSDPSCIGYDFDEQGNVIPVFEEESHNYQNRFIFDAIQSKALEFIQDLVDIFGEEIKELYYQKYYISLPHEMYINSAKKLDQEIFYGVDFEDAVGLGEKITAIQEWNREMRDKGQRRTTELFDVSYTKYLKSEISRLEEELSVAKNEKSRLEEELSVAKNEKSNIEEKYNAKEEEINKIYNSKRWKYIDKIDKFIWRKK